MKNSIKKGLGFGLTSGIITTLGMIVGLNSSTHSQAVVIGGVLIIAIADAMSDALGVLFSLNIAIIISVIWGLSLIMIFSYYISKQEKETKAFSVIFEHLFIAILVVIATNYLGKIINNIFVKKNIFSDFILFLTLFIRRNSNLFYQKSSKNGIGTAG